MNMKNRLSLGMGLLFLFVFVSLGSIIINEKSKIILLPKVEEKLNNYVKDKYKDSFNELKTTYNSSTRTYSKKIVSKDNRNLYFFVKYKNKKIITTYKTDYIEGKSLLNYIQKNMNNNLDKSKTFQNINIVFNRKLNKYSNLIQESIKKDSISSIKKLSIYSISCDTKTDNFNLEGITSSINNFYKYVENNELNPKNYSLVITDNNDISNAVEIKNLTNKLINNNLNEIISSILKKDKNIMNTYNITYKYMN